jgi:hypothetical protein
MLLTLLNAANYGHSERGRGYQAHNGVSRLTSAVRSWPSTHDSGNGADRGGLALTVEPEHVRRAGWGPCVRNLEDMARPA